MRNSLAGWQRIVIVRSRLEENLETMADRLDVPSHP
jgi:hypothetical protein